MSWNEKSAKERLQSACCISLPLQLSAGGSLNRVAQVAVLVPWGMRLRPMQKSEAHSMRCLLCHLFYKVAFQKQLPC